MSGSLRFIGGCRGVEAAGGFRGGGEPRLFRGFSFSFNNGV
ncbi:hypothetical protein CCACVL1_00380 [Corchorus capsularis]|uniref:Uncharacterized protein n=1 Tax=Corchorus capsularis TaxID=210143 RepID=A0A1R3KX28_COCAP|nr:hypothetical protein CCACVL1_00380 [Corchorus capsularis]